MNFNASVSISTRNYTFYVHFTRSPEGSSAKGDACTWSKWYSFHFFPTSNPLSSPRHGYNSGFHSLCTVTIVEPLRTGKEAFVAYFFRSSRKEGEISEQSLFRPPRLFKFRTSPAKARLLPLQPNCSVMHFQNVFIIMNRISENNQIPARYIHVANAADSKGLLNATFSVSPQWHKKCHRSDTRSVNRSWLMTLNKAQCTLDWQEQTKRTCAP